MTTPPKSVFFCRDLTNHTWKSLDYPSNASPGMNSQPIFLGSMEEKIIPVLNFHFPAEGTPDIYALRFWTGMTDASGQLELAPMFGQFPVRLYQNCSSYGIPFELP